MMLGKSKLALGIRPSIRIPLGLDTILEDTRIGLSNFLTLIKGKRKDEGDDPINQQPPLCPVPLNPRGGYGGTRQAYASKEGRTVEGYDKRVR